MLPHCANVGVAEIAGPARIRLVVWERPGILTHACGSGACAAVAAARRRGLVAAREVDVEMPGGTLRIAAHEDGRMTLTGPVAVAFSGRFSAPRREAA
jgi:diaminopimelate epimerase